MPHKLNVPLKTAIFASGKKQQTIARLARLNQTYLSHIVRGRRMPSDDEKARLARVLGKPIEELFPPQSECVA